MHWNWRLYSKADQALSGAFTSPIAEFPCVKCLVPDSEIHLVDARHADRSMYTQVTCGSAVELAEAYTSAKQTLARELAAYEAAKVARQSVVLLGEVVALAWDDDARAKNFIILQTINKQLASLVVAKAKNHAPSSGASTGAKMTRATAVLWGTSRAQVRR